MDELTDWRIVPCRSLTWCFDLCSQKNINPELVLHRISFPIEYLQNPAKFIDWQNYTAIISTMDKHFSEKELLEAGRSSWHPPKRKLKAFSGHRPDPVRNQYLASFGPDGETVKTFPVNISVIHTGHRSLRIAMNMKDGFVRCHNFHILIAGQMIGLPESLGYPKATVQITQSEHGAVYDISYTNVDGGLFTTLCNVIMQVFTTNEAVRKLTKINDDLLQNYQDLQEENEKLRTIEKKLRTNEDHHQILAANTSDVIWTMGLDQEFEYISLALACVTGYTKTELKHLSLKKILDQESNRKVTKQINSELAGNNSYRSSTTEAVFVHKMGHQIQVELKLSFILDDMKKPVSLIVVAHEITARKEMKIKLYQKETSYQIITNIVPDAIITIDQKNKIFFANPASMKIFGYELEELIGMDIDLLIPYLSHDSTFKESHRLDWQAQESEVVLKGLRKDRTLIPLEISFAADEISGVSCRTCFVRDISSKVRNNQEIKQLEKQLQLSQKMDSIGQLTGGVVHDFNNLLVAILGYTDLAISEVADLNIQRGYLNEIKLAGERAANMTRRLLAFSRQQYIEPSLVNVNELIDGINLMINRLLPENIKVKIKRADNRNLPVMADAGQLEQVLVNLAINARDAMEHGGKLTIESSLENIDDDSNRQNSSVTTGDYVVIKVTDTGSGMSQEIQHRIFEPFFSTKPEGAGTGLGLAVVSSIVRQHQGFINLESLPALGTTFSIYLPVAIRKRREPGKSSSRDIIGGSETIFIVEDNAQVRNLTRLILRGAGYEVIEAIDGLDALEKFSLIKEKIDLVLIDVVMPGTGGREVMEEMLEHRSDLKILFTSGYLESENHTKFIRDTGFELIPKPYNTNSLRSKVRSILDNQTPATHSRTTVK